MSDSQLKEVKPAFSWSYILLTLIVSLITGFIGFGASVAVEAIKKETKTVDVSSTMSGNLAAVPPNVANSLEIYLQIDPGQKEPIRSLYKYDVTIANNSPFGLDEFTAFFELPAELTLSSDPIINSNPSAILHQIKIEKLEHTLHRDIYKISLLNPHQALTLSYFGFAKEPTAPQPMTVTI